MSIWNIRNPVRMHESELSTGKLMIYLKEMQKLNQNTLWKLCVYMVSLTVLCISQHGS